VISIRQGLRAAMVISTPVLLSILITVGLLGIFGIGFSMFHAMGLILVLCIGIDYALFLYWRKKEEKELLLLGNAMAAVTTILSFGVLTLSTTTAVHSFGLTVLIGIILNFFITTLFMETTKCKKS
jgi:predicted exporter